MKHRWSQLFSSSTSLAAPSFLLSLSRTEKNFYDQLVKPSRHLFQQIPILFNKLNHLLKKTIELLFSIWRPYLPNFRKLERRKLKDDLFSIPSWIIYAIHFRFCVGV